uniref:Uncharacterized protein n=1 Tax=Romanomermis culicivorax TaxID=13658 RepID=A0A915KGV8_ROMCU
MVEKVQQDCYKKKRLDKSGLDDLAFRRTCIDSSYMFLILKFKVMPPEPGAGFSKLTNNSLSNVIHQRIFLIPCRGFGNLVFWVSQSFRAVFNSLTKPRQGIHQRIGVVRKWINYMQYPC